MSDQGGGTADVEVPENAVIQCPKHRFALVKAATCIECDCGQGLTEVTKSEAPWSDKYRIICSHPVARRTQLVGE